MTRLRWFPNALRRTLQALVPALARPDDAGAARWLEPAELALWRRLDRRERAHASAVVRRLRRRRPEASPELIAAAYLHDVGKARDRFDPLLRVLVHLRPGDAPPPERTARGVARARQTRRWHPRYGAAMIRAAGGRERVAEIVARHHAPGADAEARTLHRIDEET